MEEFFNMQNPQSRPMQSAMEVSFYRAIARHKDMASLLAELVRLYTGAGDRDRAELFGLVARDFAADRHARHHMRGLLAGG